MARKQGTRRRRIRRIVIALVVVVGLLVVADFGFGSYVEYRVSKLLRAQLKVHDDPRVAVRGFPFSTQALSGDYSNIVVDATGVPATKTVRDLAFHINLLHVHAPIGKLASGQAGRIPVDAVHGSVEVSAADIGRMLHLHDIDLGPEPIKSVLSSGTPPDKPDPSAFTGENTHHGTRAGFRLQASTSIVGQPTKVTVYGMVSLAHGQLVAKPKKLKLTNSIINTSLPDSLTEHVLRRFVFRVDPGTLPFSVTPTKVGVSDGSVSVTGHARNVVLGTGSSR